MAVAVAAVIVLAEPLLLIFGGVVFAAILDGGTRLLGRVLPIGRGWRLLIISLLALAFIIGTIWFAGVQLTAQFAALRDIITLQINRLLALGATYGLGVETVQPQQLLEQAMSSLGRLTSAVSSVLGGLTSLSMIVIIGLFIAVEPRIYERGIAWMLPSDMRGRYFRTSDRIGRTLRHLMAGRLLGMAVEGIGTWALLWAGGVPMAALLGLLTGILAFLPNIGAIISGVLIILIGFSEGVNTGLWAIAVYLIVQIARLSDRPLCGEEDGRSRPRSGARRAGHLRRSVRDHGPRPRRSSGGDDEGGARPEIGRRRSGRGGNPAAAPRARLTALNSLRAAIAPDGDAPSGRRAARARPQGASHSRLRAATRPRSRVGFAMRSRAGGSAPSRPAARAPGGSPPGGAPWPCGPIIRCAAAIPSATCSTVTSNTRVSSRLNGVPGGIGSGACWPGGSQMR